MIIFDAYAIIAYLEGEAGEKRVSELLEKAQGGETIVAITLINLGEILHIVERERGLNAAKDALGALHQLPIRFLDVDYELVLAAAHIKANYRVSYGDAFAIAAAELTDSTVVTGDPEFHAVEHLVSVEWLPG
jgi:ribonuclease VapC